MRSCLQNFAASTRITALQGFRQPVRTRRPVKGFEIACTAGATADVQVPTVALSSGHAMPVLGLGTYSLNGEIAAAAVQTAVQVGYRHFDTAQMYGNEADVGKGLAAVLESGEVKREDLFVVTKLDNSAEKKSKDGVEPAIRNSLKALQLDYVDLVLIHWPVTDRPGDQLDPPIQDTWEGLEAAVDKGLVRSIGVSNFSSKKIENWFKDARIYPAVLQVEAHPHWRNDSLLAWCKQHGVHMTAYSPLGSPGNFQEWGMDVPNALEEEPVVDVAKKNGKTPAQVLIKWGVQRGTSVIPKTGSRSRQKENIESIAGELPAEDMTTINSLPQRKFFTGEGSFFGENKPWKTYGELWDEPEP